MQINLVGLALGVLVIISLEIQDVQPVHHVATNVSLKDTLPGVVIVSVNSKVNNQDSRDR